MLRSYFLDGISIAFPPISFKTLSERDLKMDHPSLSGERRRHPRYSIDLPLNFKLTENPVIYPGLSIDASEAGLQIQTLKDMPIGIKLYIEVLFAKGFELANLQGMVQVIWKDEHLQKDWTGYKYGLKFVQISSQNHLKLKLLLSNQSNISDPSAYGNA
jgi:hypothetical protein